MDGKFWIRIVSRFSGHEVGQKEWCDSENLEALRKGRSEK